MIHPVVGSKEKRKSYCVALFLFVFCQTCITFDCLLNFVFNQLIEYILMTCVDSLVFAVCPFVVLFVFLFVSLFVCVLFPGWGTLALANAYTQGCNGK